MPRQARVRAVLTLDNSQFVKTIKQSIAFAKDLARQFAAAPIKTTMLAGLLTARNGIKATASALQEMGKIAVEAMKITAVGATAIAVALAGVSIKAISAAAQVEDLTVAFRVLLKSETAAAARMKELVNFAAHTPYMLPQVAAASRTLEVLTEGMLSTGKGLEMVGDIASATNRDFEETAVTVGRLFAALRGGTNPGEALASLQDSGAINPMARNRISGMASVNPAAAWQMAQKELARFDGMMEQKSHTWNGLMSTFHDSIFSALAAFGSPIMETLKPTLEQLTQTVFAMAPKFSEMGKDFANAINMGISVLEETFFHPIDLIDPLGIGLKMVFLQAGNVLIASIKTAAQLMPSVAESFKDSFIGATQIIAGEMMKTFEGPMAYIQATMEKAYALWNVVSNHKEAAAAQAEVRVQENILKRLTLAYQGGTSASLQDANGVVYKKVPHEELLGEISAHANQLAIARNKASAFDADATIDERRKRILADGDESQLANEQIEAGAQNMAKATQSALSAIEKAVNNFEVSDVTGAGDQMRAFMDALKQLASRGKQSVDTAAKAMQNNASSLDANKSSSSSAASMLRGDLISGGLTSNSNATGLPARVDWGNYQPGLDGLESFGGGALGQRPRRTVNSLLPLSERRIADRQARIAQIAQNFMTTGSFEESRPGAQGLASSVRRGDRAAAKQYIIGKERDAVEQQKMQAFQDAIKNAFDKTTEKYWGKGS